MHKSTDRVTDKDIINLAKQQYESEKKETVPGVIVNLISKGVIYPESSLLRRGYVNMRYMTAYDEDIITNQSYIREGIVFDMLLAELITDNIDIDTIAIADKDWLIINAKILAYGPLHQIQVIDPYKNVPVTKEIDLSTLSGNILNITSDKNGEFDYTVNDNYTIKYKYINGYDSSKNEQNKISIFLETAITQVNGDRTETAIKDFIKYKFMAADSKKFRQYYIDNEPKLNLTAEFESETGDTFKAGFRIESDLFWT